ncbi:MAG: FIST signal transduction protein [Nanoarchaeota archaeon]
MSRYIKAGTGISYNDNAYNAGYEAVKMAVKNIKSNPKFGVLFCSYKYAKNYSGLQKLVKAANKAFGCKWIGCTTAGELSNFGATHGSCVAMAVTSDYIQAGTGYKNSVSKNPEKTTKQALRSALHDITPDTHITPYVQFMAYKNNPVKELMQMHNFAIITLTPGATKKYSSKDNSILSALKDEIGGHVPIIGGAAGDDLNFEQTYQFANGLIFKDAVVIMPLSLSLKCSFGAAQGCTPTNRYFTVTSAKDNNVYTLNHLPAKGVYSELIGEDMAPFSIIGPEGRHWLRLPQSYEKDSLRFFSNVPENSTLTLMKPELKKTLNSAKNAILENKPKNIKCMFIFESVARKKFLGKNTEKQFKNIKNIAGKASFIGFNTYNEFGSSNSWSSGLLNYSLTSFTIEDNLITELK